MYDLYIMKRTQIYLDEEQDAQLARRSAATHRTKSALIRDAIDRYLTETDSRDDRLRAFKQAADAAFGSAPELPPGELYVAEIRANDQTRAKELDRRWREGATSR